MTEQQGSMFDGVKPPVRSTEPSKSTPSQSTAAAVNKPAPQSGTSAVRLGAAAALPLIALLGVALWTLVSPTVAIVVVLALIALLVLGGVAANRRGPQRHTARRPSSWGRPLGTGQRSADSGPVRRPGSGPTGTGGRPGGSPGRSSPGGSAGSGRDSSRSRWPGRNRRAPGGKLAPGAGSEPGTKPGGDRQRAPAGRPAADNRRQRDGRWPWSRDRSRGGDKRSGSSPGSPSGAPSGPGGGGKRKPRGGDGGGRSGSGGGPNPGGRHSRSGGGSNNNGGGKKRDRQSRDNGNDDHESRWFRRPRQWWTDMWSDGDRPKDRDRRRSNDRGKGKDRGNGGRSASDGPADSAGGSMWNPGGPGEGKPRRRGIRRWIPWRRPRRDAESPAHGSAVDDQEAGRPTNAPRSDARTPRQMDMATEAALMSGELPHPARPRAPDQIADEAALMDGRAHGAKEYRKLYGQVRSSQVSNDQDQSTAVGRAAAVDGAAAAASRVADVKGRMADRLAGKANRLSGREGMQGRVSQLQSQAARARQDSASMGAEAGRLRQFAASVRNLFN